MMLMKNMNDRLNILKDILGIKYNDFIGSEVYLHESVVIEATNNEFDHVISLAKKWLTENAIGRSRCCDDYHMRLAYTYVAEVLSEIKVISPEFFGRNREAIINRLEEACDYMDGVLSDRDLSE